MKRLIILAVLLFAGQAWAGEYDSALDAYHQCLSNCKGTILLPTAPLPEEKIPWADRSGVTRAHTAPSEHNTHIIKRWAASGEICRVLGHRWYYLGPGKRLFVDPKDSVERKCHDCKKVETKVEEWK
jgi:hypothetical protein